MDTDQPFMTKLETSIEIAAPIDMVWSILITYADYQNWNPYIIQIEGSATPGETIIVTSVSSVLGKVAQAPVLVVATEPYTMRWEGGLLDKAVFCGDHWLVLTPTSAGTKFAHFEHFTGTLASAILAQHGPAIESDFSIFNTALKAEAERRVAADIS